MPFSGAFQQHRLYERVRRIRKKPVFAYGVALGLVAIATAVRWAAGPELIPGVPFITYFPAIILAALICGFWPGMVSVVLSSVAAWYLFLPPFDTWELERQEAVSLGFFVGVSLLNIAIILFLDRALARVIDQEHNVRVLIESAPNGIVLVDERGEIKLVNESTERLFGYSRTELLGKGVEVLIPHDKVQEHRALRQEYTKRPEARAMGKGRDLSGRRKDGSEFPVEIGLNPVGADGKVAVLATVIDISARKRMQDAQALLVSELQHRTKNLFAVVVAIANSTLFAGRPPAEARYVFTNRMQALERAYQLVADSASEGASLGAILDRQFDGFSGRVSVSGCGIPIRVAAAQQFALIIHELTTNALKYGALSAPEGRVTIEGKIERLNGDGRFSFCWLESGGPSVSPPTTKGFGSVILEESAQQFAERVTIDFAPKGLRYELELVMSEIGAPKPPRNSPANEDLQDRSAS